MTDASKKPQIGELLSSLYIPQTVQVRTTLTGSWQRKRYWDWNGAITATEPIVALCLMRVGNQFNWSRSEKGSKTTLDVRLLLGYDEPDKSNVCVSFSIGDGQTRWWTRLDDPDKPPQPPEQFSFPVGRLFPFCTPFGTPQLCLYGLVLPRSQAVCARNRLWHLKAECCAGISDAWVNILTYGRSGSITMEAEPP